MKLTNQEILDLMVAVDQKIADGFMTPSTKDQMLDLRIKLREAYQKRSHLLEEKA